MHIQHDCVLYRIYLVPPPSLGFRSGLPSSQQESIHGSCITVLSNNVRESKGSVFVSPRLLKEYFPFHLNDGRSLVRDGMGVGCSGVGVGACNRCLDSWSNGKVLVFVQVMMTRVCKVTFSVVLYLRLY